MASNRAKNFLRGLIATQPGISRAYVEGLISEEERKEREKEEARQARMDRLYEQNVMSQIAAREPEEETPSLPKFRRRWKNTALNHPNRIRKNDPRMSRVCRHSGS
jgi:siroheme synthase (precorrin-2 oxidase/ferrochelatase)